MKVDEKVGDPGGMQFVISNTFVRTPTSSVANPQSASPSAASLTARSYLKEQAQLVLLRAQGEVGPRARLE